MSWFDDFFTSGWIGPAIGAAATLIGASTSASANEKAAETAARAAADQTAAVQEGNRLAQQRFETAQTAAAPGVAERQAVIAGGGALTPWQQTQIEDARRQTVNGMSVSGLRGSGRATVAAVRKVEGDLTGKFLSDNTARMDQAASGLSNQFFNANTQAAALDASTGQTTGAGIAQSGINQANADVANAGLRGAAIGDIATVVNDSWKEGRKSNYAPQQQTSVSERDNQNLPRPL